VGVSLGTTSLIVASFRAKCFGAKMYGYYSLILLIMTAEIRLPQEIYHHIQDHLYGKVKSMVVLVVLLSK